MDENNWVLDGNGGKESLRRLFREIPRVISDEQKKTLLKFLPSARQCLADNDLYQLLEDIEKRIEEVGKNTSGELNDTGRILKRLYTEIDEQN